MIHRSLNLIGFYAGWWACIYGACARLEWVGPAVVLVLTVAHLTTVGARADELRLLGRVSLLGLVVESGQLATGVLGRVDGGGVVCPVWMVALWLNLGITLRSSMGWLQGREVLAAVLGAVSGPASYWAGARLGAVHLSADPAYSLLVLAVVWALLMPLVLRWARRGAVT